MPLLFFFIWPFGSLVYAIKNYTQSISVKYVWLFIAFFGFTLYSVEGSDSQGYMKALMLAHQHQTGLVDIFKQYASSGNEQLDFARVLITFLVSRFTSSGAILFGVYGIILGYFYANNIFYLLSKVDKLEYGIFLFAFVAIIPFWSIGNPRFSIAAHMFFFGMIRYLLDEDAGKIWVSFCSLIFHFSMGLPLALFIAYKLVGDKVVLYFIFFLLSFIITVNPDSVSNFLNSYLPFIAKSKAGYLDQEYIQSRIEGSASLNWYVTAPRVIVWFSRSWLVFLFLFSRKQIESVGLIPIFCYTLLLCSFGNIAAKFPSGSRFLNVGCLFAVAFIFIFFQHSIKTEITSLLIRVWKPVLFVYLLIMCWFSFSDMSISCLISNPIIYFFVMDSNSNVSVMTLLKSILQ